MKREITFRSPTIAAARDREHWIKQCRSSGCVIGKHRFHTATQLHRRPFSPTNENIISSNIKMIHSFIHFTENVFVFAFVLKCYLKMRLEREFCLGMRNGELAGLAPEPAASLDATVVRAAVDRRTDLAALAAANDIALPLGFWFWFVAAFLFQGFCISFRGFRFQ